MVAGPDSTLVFAECRVQRSNIAALVIAEEFLVAGVVGVTTRIAGGKGNRQQTIDNGKYRQEQFFHEEDLVGLM